MKNGIFICTFIFLAFLVPINSFGQTRCPVGVQAGGTQCLPDDDGSAPPRPTGEWIKTWGAIVLSDKGQEGWSSVGEFSEDAAAQDALSKCHAAGVTDCSVKMTYFNQCVAIANPKKGMGSSIDTGKNESVASQRASEDCRKNFDSQCVVKFTECSDPFFRKY